jgi:trans-AT polyketide synthase/acyltransferase/oxidoreductase domain-containing protein
MKDVKVVFMYSGQGSQYYLMGKDLYDSDTVFKHWMDVQDSDIKEIMGVSVLNTLYRKTGEKLDVFNEVLYTSPAIFMLEYALSKTLIERGITPNYLLGASLGEFVSMAVSNVLNYKDILNALTIKSKLLEKYSIEGGMLAVLANKEVFYENDELVSICELASDNYDNHFVLAGGNKEIEYVNKYFKKKDIVCQKLPVSIGFHSAMIDKIENEFKEHFVNIKPNKPEIDIVSCSEANINPNVTPEFIWNILRSPIRFKDTYNNFNNENIKYIDLGPSGTLANFISNSAGSKSQAFSIITPYGSSVKKIEKLEKESFIQNVKTKKYQKKSNMKAYLFPGQGSQAVGMGKDLFDEFSEYTQKADEILGYSIKELCLEDAENKLTNTQYTQPSLYVVNALSYLKKIQDDTELPNYVAGHSLGEFNALFASGVFDFETGLKLVKKRGELMAQAKNGGMAAVIGLTETKIKEILEKNNLTQIDIANLNTPSQIVISGPKDDIVKAQPIFETEGCTMYVILKVGGAFHSRLMEESGKQFEEYIKNFNFSSFKIPVISNVAARPYKSENLLSLLSKQITHSVKWTESICYLMGKGVEEFVEVGPGRVLAGMLRKIKAEAEPLIVEDIVESEEIKCDEKFETDESGTICENESVVSDVTVNDINTIIDPQKLGSSEFRKDYNLKYSYAVGGMFHGITSKEMVVKLGHSGIIGFFGTGGLSLENIDESILYIKNELNGDQPFGVNVLNGSKEDGIIDLILKHQIRNIEASAYLQVTPGLVRYRAKGLSKGKDGSLVISKRIMAKVSRPEVANSFLNPAPEDILSSLLLEGKITKEEAELCKKTPMADDICVESDSGGHTDQGVLATLLPAIIKLKNDISEKNKYNKNIRVGAAGGIGTPNSAAAAFMLGADFILTGSINQCTVEAGTSELVKDLLQEMNVQDTEYAPAGDMFEMGSKVQVLKKGLFFPSRANKLFDVYRNYNSLEEIDEATKNNIQERFFNKSFDQVFEECKSFYSTSEIEKAEASPKQKMAMVFKWYFGKATRLAIGGEGDRKVDFQVHCGPSLGAFNQWVKGTELKDWRKRHVDNIGIMLMEETAVYLNETFGKLCKN